MRFLLLATAAMSAQELRRVDDASSGGAVVAVDGSADDRPVWADGRLAVAVAAADGSLIELGDHRKRRRSRAHDGARRPRVCRCCGGRGRAADDARRRRPRRGARRGAAGAARLGARRCVCTFRGTKVVVRAYDAADGGPRDGRERARASRCQITSRRPGARTWGARMRAYLVGETVLTLDQRAPGAEDAPIRA